MMLIDLVYKVTLQVSFLSQLYTHLNHPQMISSTVQKTLILNTRLINILSTKRQSNIIKLLNNNSHMYTKNNKQSFYKNVDFSQSNQQNSRIYRKQTAITHKRDNRQRDSNHISEWKSNQKQTNYITVFFEQQQQGKLALIQQLKEQGKVRELSMIAQEMLFQPQSSQTDLIWCAIEQAFLSSLKPTKNQNQIRSFGKVLYALGKSKKATRNYETQMALLLPFSSHQSFTQIVTTISRMGGMSEQFSHIVEKLYWKRKEQFSKLEINLVNYVLAKNGKKIDAQLIEYINSFPLKSIVMMLKSYDMASSMTPDILKKCIPQIIARKNQTNFLDLRGLFNIYSKYLYLDNDKLIAYFEEQYHILARNVNEQAMEEMWEYFPQAVNANKLPIKFVEQLIKSLKILKTRQRISQRTWKKIALKFNKFQNLQIRTQLEKI